MAENTADFVAGWASGAVATLATQPVDLVITRLQAGTARSISGAISAEPITALWRGMGPLLAVQPISNALMFVGYGAGKSAGYTELDAYAKANFTMVMVSDRNNRLDAQNRTLNCDASDPSRGWQASLDYLDEQVTQVEKRGMQSIFDTYRCLPWGGAANSGGASQGGGGWVSQKHGVFVASNHKITLPEVKYLAQRMRNRTSCVGLLITDDGVDLHENELAEVEWMRQNTPELYPWVNQCGDGR